MLQHHEPFPVPIAIRVYPEPPNAESRPRSVKQWRRPDAMLVFDTETSTDPSQCLMFGSYRFIEAGKCREEGLFYADELPTKDRKVLERYVATHGADADKQNLLLLTRRQFHVPPS
jgi:hypothetical protein